jgi:hypothetical protein
MAMNKFKNIKFTIIPKLIKTGNDEKVAPHPIV